MAERKVNDKIKKRERIFAALKRHEQFLEGYDPNSQSGQVQLRLEKLDKKFEEFEKVQEEIALLDEKGDIEEDSNAACMEFENQYYELRSALAAKIAPPVQSTAHLDNTIARNTSTLGIHTGVRLPQIALPEFNGDYRVWLSFKSIFVSMIHESTELCDVQKFHYLKTALKGEAAKLIESLTITNENYLIAWETITKRYSNEYLLKKRHIQALMEYPRLNEASAAAIHGLVDEFEQRMKILKQLGERTEHWGAFIVHWMCSKLDIQTLQLWEDHAASIKEPGFVSLVDFLEKRTRILDAISSNITEARHHSQKPSMKRSNVIAHAAANTGNDLPACHCCGDSHYISRCTKFQAMNLSERLDMINNKRLCSNCFRPGHWARDCNSKFNCRTCGKRHNSLIHPGFPLLSSEIAAGPSSSDIRRISSNIATENAEVEQTAAMEEPAVGSFSVEAKTGPSHIFLSTVVLVVKDRNGDKQLARALLDNGSQVNIMSERLCQTLKLKRRAVNVSIYGIGQAESKARHAVSATIGSRMTDYTIGMDFLVLQKVTTELPSVTVPITHWKVPEGLMLADPDFNTSKRIDLIIGAEHFYDFLKEKELKRINLGIGLPTLVDTKFGWIVTGKLNVHSRSPVHCHAVTASDSLENIMEKFWKIESCEDQHPWSKQEQDCEESFVKTYSRAEDGRYSVRLPKHVHFERMLGESRRMALERFIKLEKRLERNISLKKDYHAFMAEYIELGHMKKVTEEELQLESMRTTVVKTHYLPHHPVIKNSSTTTKVRVVFDGSACTDSGYSLNDTLLKGPVIQDELLSLLLRFRKHKIALVADIEKMYRQIRLHQDDSPLQRVFWRFSATDPIETYELLTVTYGLTPSSFLATRTLKQLALDVRSEHPEASMVLENDLYIDDLISGTSSIDRAIILRNELEKVTEGGGFSLRKWVSNRFEVLEGLPMEKLGKGLEISFDLISTEHMKTLGVTWDPRSDQLSFNFDVTSNVSHWTRRSILSTIAKMFDPLGLISPVIVRGKIIMQKLALLQSGWDDLVPTQLVQEWEEFFNKLSLLSKVRINRVAFCSEWTEIQFHCFADASELAYGACLYVRAIDDAGNIRIELLSSKSRVAPLKRLTLPRLELCAADTAAHLYSKVIKSLKMNNTRSYFWSDSTIVLHWLKAPPNTWQTFIANRVSRIQTLTYGHGWQHIAGKDNPADLVSRGMPVEEFLQSALWKSGPAWLMQTANTWPVQMEDFTYFDMELETRNITHMGTVAPETNYLFHLHSSIEPLLRIVAYCLRFSRNCRQSKQNRVSSFLMAKEIQAAKSALVRLVQLECFSEDIHYLLKHHQVSNKSSLKLLNPFMDQNGIVRVGGRLRHSDAGFNTKHPAVLPNNHNFTRMLVDYYHRQTIHGSRQLTLSAMRQEFWPLQGKKVVQSVLRNCYRCFRVNPTAIQQPMGQLPSTRVRPSKPFAITGIDYCGPFYLKAHHRRAATPKVYVAVFICFATKAIHLEAVSNLSTAGFISALRRFIGHHGVPSEIHSDNAKNFAGAKHELHCLYKTLNDQAQIAIIGNELTQQGISWQFIPPRAPNFGGLWEAAVRTVKSALKKEIGLIHLSLEDFATLLVQISAALNSRPLVPLSDDPTDIDALTPAHFLIGSTMRALPESDLRAIPMNRLTHYQQRQKLFQRYWQRWSKEYLTELQMVNKNLQRTSIKVGDLAVLREDNQPPLCWPLARVIEVHPGKDGVVRVVSVKTANGIYKRPVCRLCPLPSTCSQLKEF